MNTPVRDARHRRRWSELSPGQRCSIVLAAAVQVTLAGCAWLDLVRRPASDVRGPKPAWAAMIAVNFVGPLAYFRWGRSRRQRSHRAGRSRDAAVERPAANSFHE